MLTVQQVRDKLKEFPPEMVVVVYDDIGFWRDPSFKIEEIVGPTQFGNAGDVVLEL